MDLIYKCVHIIKELDYKTRKIRSFRGFLQYVLEIMGKTNYKILSTNLEPLFWSKIQMALRQNKPGVLEKFLFGSSEINLEDKIETLENQVSLLQQRITKLESKHNLKSIETTEQDNLNSNFISLKEIDLKDKIDIIGVGFDLNRANKISLKNFYETTGEFSLFQIRGYRIKYNSIRRDKDYISLSKQYIAANQ